MLISGIESSMTTGSGFPGPTWKNSSGIMSGVPISAFRLSATVLLRREGEPSGGNHSDRLYRERAKPLNLVKNSVALQADFNYLFR
ncbi:hypothetical protein REMIM1_PF00984 (plasmid) [Rhizobium etli bv. mimosae str. Mim1]|nr:hypothetical protein REMIM1_PF00984 [Rhizobium etli bv. mimosae str. Mim1]